MRKKRQIFQFLLIAGFLFAVASACDKTDDPGDDFPSVGTVTDADGNKYNTVKIGKQVWTVENLKTIKYNDGTPIPNVLNINGWSSLKTGAYCNYDNLESNVKIYGRLYNWYAVETGMLAPAGWHVPTDEDWTILKNYLIDNGYNYDGTLAENKIAKALCAKTNWSLSSEAGTPGAAPEINNSTGFTALPGGYRRNHDGAFTGIEIVGCWWSFTEYSEGSDYAERWVLHYKGQNFDSPSIQEKTFGFSVRLVKDNSSPASLPTLNTSEITSITQTTATSGGNITYHGGAPITARGVCWNTTGNPTIADSKTTDGTGTGTFSSSLTGLITATPYYVRAYATNSEGTAYGKEKPFATRSERGAEIVIDADGIVYNTVKIGNQIWTVENLKATKYNEGTPIPNVTDKDEWVDLKTGAYYNYDNLESNAAIYGRLYNWYAVNTGKLSPAGWHVPTDEDWTILQNYLIAKGYNYDGSTGKNKIAKSLCAKTNWKLSDVAGSPGNAPENNNSTGFTALPGGSCFRYGTGGLIGVYGGWWSSTKYTGGSAYNWYLGYRSEDLHRMYNPMENGYSVRLVKD